MYFILHNCEDGLTIDKVTGEELLEKITPDEEGNTYYGSGPLEFSEEVLDFDEAVHTGRRPPHHTICIIKGEFVTPKLIKIVTKFEL